jgi:hypothetical protein
MSSQSQGARGVVSRRPPRTSRPPTSTDLPPAGGTTPVSAAGLSSPSSFPSIPRTLWGQVPQLSAHVLPSAQRPSGDLCHPLCGRRPVAPGAAVKHCPDLPTNETYYWTTVVLVRVVGRPSSPSGTEAVSGRHRRVVAW